MAGKYWLLKAEPDSRITKGKDVKFSVDDFEAIKTTPWEGVRSYEPRNLIKEMKVGDNALFYHSNCKSPGIAGFAEVSKEAYPDYTAWDITHPYYDAKTKQEDPKWYMVDLTFISRVKHFVPLALLRHIADLPSFEPPAAIEYIGESGVKAVKAMDLVARGRLSVQRVDEKAWDVIEMLADRGGWAEMDLRPKKDKVSVVVKKGHAKKRKATGKGKQEVDEDEGGVDVLNEELEEGTALDAPEPSKEVSSGRKRKAEGSEFEGVGSTPRRSTRTRR